jgi:rhodanese-related sulfurtransferase
MLKAQPAWKWLPVALAAAITLLLLRSPAAGDAAVSPAEAARLIKHQKDLQLIDVRTQAEFADGHLAGARLIPVQEIAQRLAEIDKQKPVLLYCHTGLKSGKALTILQDHGYPQAKHLEGGLMAWQAAGLPVTK